MGGKGYLGDRARRGAGTFMIDRVVIYQRKQKANLVLLRRLRVRA